MEAYIDPNLTIDSDYIEGQNSIIMNFLGCNFNCPICFLPAYVKFKSDSITSIKTIKEEIQRIHPNAENIVFTGGEPTLQRLALGNLCRYANSLNLTPWVHTNCSKPSVINYLIQNDLCSNFILDIKSSFDESLFEKSTNSKGFFVSSSQLLTDIKKTLQILYEKKEELSLEFRSTVVPGVIHQKEHFESIAREIAKFQTTYTIQNFTLNEDENQLPLNPIFKKTLPLSDNQLNELKDFLERKFPQLRIQTKP